MSVRVSLRKTKGLSDERVVCRRLRSGCEKIFHLRKEFAPRRGAGVWADRAKDQDWTEIVRRAIVCVRGSGFGHWCPNEPWFGIKPLGVRVWERVGLV